MASERVIAATLCAVLVAGCGGGLRRFPLRDPMWLDRDQRPFKGQPDEYFSPFGWDAANQTAFRPVSRFFAVDPAGESIDVNALDEVPDSSWFVNRVSRAPLSPSDMASGPCTTPPLDPNGPWTVTGAKPNGYNPGFLIKDADGRKFLVKFDGVVEGERPTAADAVGSRLYYAAGYYAPCNRIVYFDRKILRIDPKAKAEQGRDKVPLTEHHLDLAFSKALMTPDGRYRAISSLFVAGKPIGPWTYQGTRSDDPNDVVAHEDRRELRGGRVIAAWLNHFDTREVNTLASFIPVVGGRGYVRHYLIDFGDSFGSIWEPPMLGRRIGHAYYLDFPYIVEDFLTLGLIRRPWDRARFGPSGTVFGYWNVELFEPDKWHPGYPNPAFGRMSEHDAAWMARIIAEFRDEHLRAIVEQASFGRPLLTTEMLRILRGRRDKILARYFAKLSPLARPELAREAGAVRLCLRDLATFSGVARSGTRTYESRAWLGDALTPSSAPALSRLPPDRVCAALPAVPGASRSAPQYLIVDLVARSPGEAVPGPARVHLYHLGGDDYRVVGLERPEDHDPPG